MASLSTDELHHLLQGQSGYTARALEIAADELQARLSEQATPAEPDETSLLEGPPPRSSRSRLAVALVLLLIAWALVRGALLGAIGALLAGELLLLPLAIISLIPAFGLVLVARYVSSRWYRSFTVLGGTYGLLDTTRATLSSDVQTSGIDFGLLLTGVASLILASTLYFVGMRGGWYRGPMDPGQSWRDA